MKEPAGAGAGATDNIDPLKATSTGDPLEISLPEHFVITVFYSQVCHILGVVSVTILGERNLLKRPRAGQNVLAFQAGSGYKGRVD